MRLKTIFDLDFTLCCGQVFRWNKINGWWYGVVDDNVVKIRQNGAELEFCNVSEEFVVHYFGLNDDLEKISLSIAKDDHIKKALHRFKGLRIIRQVPWECLISFICATYKSIAAIELMLSKLSREFGEKMFFEGMDFYSFPKVEKLAFASQNDLRDCGLGYRIEYLQGTAKKIYEDKIELETFKRLPYDQVRKSLIEFPGVGPKVADCVLLFSLEKMNAFPIDVWVKRAILHHYVSQLQEDLVKKLLANNSMSNSVYEKINAFGRKYFGDYAGYAQEYLYHYERSEL